MKPAKDANLLGVEPEPEAQARGPGRPPADAGDDGLFEDLLGVLGGHLLDVHAALGRGHDRDAAGGAVEGHAEVELVLDVQALLDEQALHLLALGAGLVRDQLHAEIALHGLLRRRRVALAHLDAAALAAAAGVDLRLDDDDLAAGLRS